MASVPETTTVPRHILTEDYLQGNFGTDRVSARTAAPYLSWAQTSPYDAVAMKAVGIKTQFYADPNLTLATDPLHKMVGSTGFARTCSSAMTYRVWSTHTQYIMGIGSSSLRSAYNSYLGGRINRYNSIDAVFEDAKFPLSVFGSTVKPGMPCSYSDSTWVTQAEGLSEAIKWPTIFNGLSELSGTGVSKTVALLNSPKIIGGTFESCFATYTTTPEITGSRWETTEQTQIDVLAKHKLFFCLERNSVAASVSSRARLYVLASLLLTYSPTESILWDEFGTPSGLHVMPESQFVPLNPVRAQPTAISELKSSYGPYYRQYNSCYYAGRSVGACAVVVNPNTATERFPLRGYYHTLSVRGYGIFDHGTASTVGAAPPSTMAAGSAVIAIR